MAIIKRSLYEHNLLCGIQRNYAIFLGSLFLGILFYGNLWDWIVGGIIIATIWSVLAYANSIDPIFFKVLIRHLRQSNAYLAHSKPHHIPCTKISIKAE